MRQPPALASRRAASGSKLSALVLRPASSREAAAGSENRSRATAGRVLHAPRMDLEEAVAAAVGELDHLLEERCPHVELDLLGHTQVPVEEIGEAVAAARPRLDGEGEPVALARGAELDLAGLEVPGERDEAEGARRDLDDAHRAVPRPRHAHYVLVADAQRAVLAADLVESRELARRRAVGVDGDPRHELLGQKGDLVGFADADPVGAVEEGSCP